MQYRYLGSSGLQVSALSFGAWITFSQQVGESEAAACMYQAFDAGVNFFDNAEVNAGGEAEVMMGKIFRQAEWDRSEFLVSTKIFWGGEGPNQRGLSRKHIIEGTDGSLRRLQLDYVDLLFCHRPDVHTPVEETVRAMNHIINQGKALYWGTSEWDANRILEAHSVARREHLIPPLMEQAQYNMFHRERVEAEYASLYDDIGLGLTTWSPLAGGLLTGKYNSGLPEDSRANLEGYEWLRNRFTGDEAERRVAKVKSIAGVADDLGCSIAQLSLAWCLQNPNVSTVITGASRPSQVNENMKAVQVLDKLDDDINKTIAAVLDNAPSPEIDWRV